MAQLAEIAPGVFRAEISRGRVGTAQTLELMRRLVERGARDPIVRQAAVRAVFAAGVRSHDFPGEVRALFNFVRDRIRFVRDPAGVEMLQDARRTLTTGAGDCDCRAILLASLLKSIGNPVQLRFKVIGADPRRPNDFSHVYLVANLNGRDVALDPTYPDNGLGWEYPRPLSAGEFPL